MNVYLLYLRNAYLGDQSNGIMIVTAITKLGLQITSRGRKTQSY